MAVNFSNIMLKSLGEYLSPGMLAVLLPILFILGVWWIFSENKDISEEEQDASKDSSEGE